ncbi:54S ribosomal protein L3-like protein [Hapsidospora chrysogenum ATCC 11550]|uniref:Large ribosomal subunit protein mL44 n=1 Tax=Hapsidospora chrysogenum (strain ATCC 11550 / CBS 779.69 / DSM 880 / IAM 14645 / JCM 23072 / IMI 49137) TaxID=857340 RepID=A0A086T5E1_HAPC1|nr:54S ribosomal protein L3-like protein [Hapsidospora chrysogenum ATCC 11550]
MKRLRPSQWSGQLLQARSSGAAAAGAAPPAGAAAATISRRPFFACSVRCQSYSATAASPSPDGLPSEPADATTTTRTPLPSPPPERALQSAKLAALHARLSLSKKIPLQTLARALVHPTADPNESFNNANLTQLGTTIINYHVLEYLVCKWPRLPMAVLYAALKGYAGDEALTHVARRWGTEEAAAPGEEVDPGLLQWSPNGQHNVKAFFTPGYVRADKPGARRGLSSRVVLDDDFGDKVNPRDEKIAFEEAQRKAFGSFARAVVGSIYAHCGHHAAKAFVDAHVLSRHLDISRLFHFNMPTRDLSMLCAREGFEPPLARLESETGRLSRTPVFVVGIYSGTEKLGEASGASLDDARRKAAMAALKAWYLYSPGNQVRVPSDMMEEGAKPWKAPYIDIGEIIS